MSNVIPEKPNLSLYVGRTVKSVYRLPDTEAWEWYIEFDNGVLIRNYSKDETHMPSHVEGMKFISFSMSVADTTMHFESSVDHVIHKWGLKPTSYTVHDPRHGGEVIPQWPEELEERKIYPRDIGFVSDSAPDTWETEYENLTQQADARAKNNAQEFLTEDGNAQS